MNSEMIAPLAIESKRDTQTYYSRIFSNRSGVSHLAAEDIVCEHVIDLTSIVDNIDEIIDDQERGILGLNEKYANRTAEEVSFAIELYSLFLRATGIGYDNSLIEPPLGFEILTCAALRVGIPIDELIANFAVPCPRALSEKSWEFQFKSMLNTRKTSVKKNISKISIKNHLSITC